MAYTKQTWKQYDDNKTEEQNIQDGAVVTAERMNRIEEGLENHSTDKTNPHGVTKNQVGLDKVDNVQQAPKSDFDTHVANKNNPHSVTKSQVGLGNVDNVQQAPLTDFTTHKNDKTNPHSVTKAQTGLGSVDNYSTATQSEAELGTSSIRFMTPLRVFQAIAKWTSGKFMELTGNQTVAGTKNFKDGLQLAGKVVQAGIVERAITDSDRSDTTYVTGVNGVLTRVGNVVTLAFNFQCNTWPSGTETRWVIKIPTGYQRSGSTPVLHPLTLLRNAAQPTDARAYLDGIIVNVKSGNGSSYVSGTWITQDDWPS
ncbi:hypothetical protein [Enterococcus sp. AZ103]|uniref:hypothetical protein n=1 Tax=Enterococcus sp. AZ103 TaxID=2774628 RepID=UPI003F23D7E9